MTTNAVDSGTERAPKLWGRLVRLLGDRERVIVRGPQPTDQRFLVIKADEEKQ
jgi:hypothetical protein